MEDVGPDLGEILGLEVVAQRLPRLIASRFDQPSLDLVGLRVSQRVLIASREVLGVVGLVVAVNRGVEDLIKPA